MAVLFNLLGCVRVAVGVAVRVTMAVSMAVIMTMIVIVRHSRVEHVHHDNVEDETEDSSDQHELTINLILNKNSLESLNNEPNCQSQQESDGHNCPDYFTSVPPESVLER